jgi:hypothetical protein
MNTLIFRTRYSRASGGASRLVLWAASRQYRPFGPRASDLVLGSFRNDVNVIRGREPLGGDRVVVAIDVFEQFHIR